MKRLSSQLASLVCVLFTFGLVESAQSNPRSPQISQVERIPSQTFPEGTRLDPGRFNVAAADLVLEKLDVENLGGDRVRVTATLRNGSPSGNGQAYPGGGQLVIERSSGGTILTKPSDAFVALPDGGTPLASQPIPRLEFGQAITLSATTQGRAIFSASALPDRYRPDVPTKPLSERNPNNNRKEVNTLIARKHPISSRTLGFLSSSFLNQIQIRLDRDDSYIKLPKLSEQHWTMPEKSYDLFLTRARYYVHDINSTNLEMSIEQGALVLSLAFETDGSEVVGVGVLPDIDADSITAQIKLPLSYDTNTQYLSYSNPQVSVNVANPSFSGPASLLDSLIPNINKSASQAIQKLFTDPKLKRQLEYQLNQQLREPFVRGGRIVNVSIGTDEITLQVEAGA